MNQADPEQKLLAPALAELLAFPARFLGALPLPTRILLEVSGINHQIVFECGAEPVPARASSARASNEEPARAASRALVFSAGEVAALAQAVEADRLWPADFKAFCLRKRLDASFQVTPELALSGAQPEPSADGLGTRLPLGAVLDQLELELASAAVLAPIASNGDEEPLAGAFDAQVEAA
jgi:hypothetical protein